MLNWVEYEKKFYNLGPLSPVYILVPEVPSEYVHW